MSEKHRLIIGLLKLFDLFIVVLAFALTTILIVKAEHGVSVARFFSMRTRIVNFVIVVLALFICHFMFLICGLYRSRRLSRRRTEVVDVLKAMTLNTACFVALASFFSIKMITIQFLGVFWIVSTVGLSSARLAIRRAAGYLRLHGRNLRYILILGTNPRAVEFAKRILGSPERGYHLLGFVDDDWPGISAFKNSGFEVVSECAKK